MIKILRYVDGTICCVYDRLGIVGGEVGCCLFDGTLVGIKDVTIGDGVAVGVVSIGWVDGGDCG